MVAGLEPATKQNASSSQNRVMNILMSRLGESKTFAENLIFMLNRASEYKDSLRRTKGLTYPLSPVRRRFVHATARPEAPVQPLHN